LIKRRAGLRKLKNGKFTELKRRNEGTEKGQAKERVKKRDKRGHCTTAAITYIWLE